MYFIIDMDLFTIESLVNVPNATGYTPALNNMRLLLIVLSQSFDVYYKLDMAINKKRN